MRVRPPPHMGLFKFDRYMGLCETSSMDEADRKLLQKIFSLPEDKQQRISAAMRGLLAKLKTEWEARPENTGKTVTYTELWDEHAKKMKKDSKGRT